LVTPVPTSAVRSYQTAQATSASRTGEMVLGIVGGVFGLLVAGFEWILGGLGRIFGASSAGMAIQLSTPTFIASTLGIIAAAVVGIRPRLCGALMILAAVLGLIGASLFYAIPAVLLGVGGLLALTRKERPMTPLPQAMSYCMKCGRCLTYVPHFQKWYCETCKTYA